MWYLFDMYILIWWWNVLYCLFLGVVMMMIDCSNMIFVSVIFGLEIVIKVCIG